MISSLPRHIGRLMIFVFTVPLISCQHYTNSYAVHIDGDPSVARIVAAKHGFIYVDQV